MVREIKKKNKKYFECGECGFIYKEKSWAQKCENFCDKNNSCSIEITKHAIRI